MSRMPKTMGLAITCLAGALMIGCESTQTADTSADTSIEAEPVTETATAEAASAEATPAEVPADGEVSVDSVDGRADPFSEKRVDELEQGLKPLETVPINTGLGAYGDSDTSVG